MAGELGERPRDFSPSVTAANLSGDFGGGLGLQALGRLRGAMFGRIVNCTVKSVLKSFQSQFYLP